MAGPLTLILETSTPHASVAIAGADGVVEQHGFCSDRNHNSLLFEPLEGLLGGRADQVGFYMVGVTKPELASQVAAAIDQLFQNSLAQTLTETERAFQLSFVAMTEAILTAIQLISLVVIVVILAVVANTMAMTTRERLGEYAVLKTLGFGGHYIAGLIFGESMVITMLGCLAGIAATFPAAMVFSHALSTYFPVFSVGTTTVFLDLVAGMFVATAAAVIPTRRAIRIRIADGLRRIG